MTIHGRRALAWNMTGWPRTIAVVVTGVVSGGVLVLGVGLLVGGRDWATDTLDALTPPDGPSIRQRIRSSGPARWWRCLGSGRPLLSGSVGMHGRWTLSYSWHGGYGGAFDLTLDSEGRATLLQPARPDGERYEAGIPVEDVRRIARLVDRQGLFCLATRDRTDHQIIDLGTYEFSVETIRTARTVRAGQCHYVDDPVAFGAVQEALSGLASRFGVRIVDSPLGITHAPGPCMLPARKPGALPE